MRSSVELPQLNRHRYCRKAYCPRGSLCQRSRQPIYPQGLEGLNLRSNALSNLLSDRMNRSRSHILFGLLAEKLPEKFGLVDLLAPGRMGAAQMLGIAFALPNATLTRERVSTLALTVLLAIGLFFFLRASGKDRVEARFYFSSRSLEEMGSLLRKHLEERAYRLQSADAEGIATFAGQARASAGLAVFLTGLAGVGLACLALVLQMLEPGWGAWPWTLLLVSPWAGWYYWRRSHRPEQIRLKLQAADSPPGSLLWVEGQRDELEVLAATLGLQERDPERG